MPVLASGRYSQPYSHNYNQKSKGLFLLEHILLLHTTKSTLVVCWLGLTTLTASKQTLLSVRILLLPHGCQWVNVSSGIGSPG